MTSFACVHKPRLVLAVVAEIDGSLPLQYSSWLAPSTGALAPGFYQIDAPLLRTGCGSSGSLADCGRPVTLPAASATGRCVASPAPRLHTPHLPPMSAPPR